MTKMPFWKRKNLEELSVSEWESLCDGCALCCLIKLEDEDSGEVAYTDVVCELLNIGACKCTDYDNRNTRVPTCIELGPTAARDLGWLPSTCAYRLVASGEDLYWWHPLVSGDPKTVHSSSVSVQGWCVSETKVKDRDLEDHIRGIIVKE